MDQLKTFPIVLAHGVCRPDALPARLLRWDNAEHDGLHYFRGVRKMLSEHGFDAWHSKVEFASGVKMRAASLKRNVEDVLQQSGAKKAHIVGHSMGGLDARHMLYDNRDVSFHQQIASVTTIGTPHWGTSFADWGLNRLRAVERLILRLGFDVRGFRDLRTGPCAAFNTEAADFEKRSGVFFQTFAGALPIRYILGTLKPSAYVIQRCEGENDGLVSLRSAQWRDAYFGKAIDADHLNLIGWWTAERLLRGETPGKFQRRIHDFYLDAIQTVAERFPC